MNNITSSLTKTLRRATITVAIITAAESLLRQQFKPSRNRRR